MKKLLLFIFVCILITGQLFSQPSPQWSSSIGSNFQYYFLDNPKVKFDNAGDLIVCGNMMTTSNGMDMLLIKYSTTGSLIWLKTYNGVNNKDDGLVDFEIDSQNNIYVTGKTTINTNNSDAITIKFDSGGNFIWQNIFSGYCNRNDQGQSISLDNNNNSYITGFTEVDSSNWSRKFFIRKIDANGLTVWSKRHGSDSTARHDGVKIRCVNNEVRVIGNKTANPNKYIVLNIDPNGNYIFANEAPYIKGMSSSFIDKFGNFYWGAESAYKTTKINSNGNFAWIDSVGTNLPFNVSGDEVRAITVDSLQNVYTTGRHYGPSSAFTNCDVLTVKYSSNGSIQWSKRYDFVGTNSCDIGNSICLDSLLNVYIGAESERTSTSTDYDYAIIKYNNSASQFGTIRYNDPQSKDDVISSIIVDKYGCIYVTGMTMDNFSLSNITTQKYCSFTGIKENSLSNSIFKLSPNPTNGIFSIELNEPVNLKMYSATGALVYEKTFSASGNFQLDISHLSNSIYHLRTESKQGAFHSKLIKE